MQYNFDKANFKTLLGLNMLDDKALEDFIKENYTAILHLEISDDEVMIEIDDLPQLLSSKFNKLVHLAENKKYIVPLIC